MKSHKILVEILHQLSHQQIFFALWAFMAFGFAYLIWQFQKKRDQRNFREGSNHYNRPVAPKLSGKDEKHLPKDPEKRLPDGK